MPRTIGSKPIGELREEINEAVGGDQRIPLFYAISGSRLQGFPSPESDIDVVGFHLSTKPWANLDSPKSHVSVKDNNVDLRSWELKKFGQRLYRQNFREIEAIFNAPIVSTTARAQVLNIRTKARARLPMNLPRNYYRMGRGQYNGIEDEDAVAAKYFLYPLRALLTARYLVEHNDLVANIFPLTQMKDGSRDVVTELVAHRVESGDDPIGDDLHERAANLIEELIENDDYDDLRGSFDRDGWKSDIDEWMEAVRVNEYQDG